MEHRKEQARSEETETGGEEEGRLRWRGGGGRGRAERCDRRVDRDRERSVFTVARPASGSDGGGEWSPRGRSMDGLHGIEEEGWKQRQRLQQQSALLLDPVQRAVGCCGWCCVLRVGGCAGRASAVLSHPDCAVVCPSMLDGVGQGRLQRSDDGDREEWTGRSDKGRRE